MEELDFEWICINIILKEIMLLHSVGTYQHVAHKYLVNLNNNLHGTNYQYPPIILINERIWL